MVLITLYKISAAAPEKASCAGENVGPDVLVVKVGRTRPSVATAVSVASAPVTPSTRKSTTRWRSAPTRMHRPTTPLQTIMKAANTVSRARVDASSPPDTISVTISPTSMTVTATARISVPSGSPTRWATTSAWWTAATTAATSPTATNASSASTPGERPQVAASTSAATGGTTKLQRGSVRCWVTTTSRGYRRISPRHDMGELRTQRLPR